MGGSFAVGRGTAPVPPPVVITKTVPAPVVPAPEQPKAKSKLLSPPPLTKPAPIVKEHKKRIKERKKKEAKTAAKAVPLNCEPSGSGLPSCARVRQCSAQMSWSQQMAAYRRSTPAQIAHGKRCLGL